jgi:hypothetical protein
MSLHHYSGWFWVGFHEVTIVDRKYEVLVGIQNTDRPIKWNFLPFSWSKLSTGRTFSCMPKKRREPLRYVSLNILCINRKKLVWLWLILFQKHSDKELCIRTFNPLFCGRALASVSLPDELLESESWEVKTEIWWVHWTWKLDELRTQ